MKRVIGHASTHAAPASPRRHSSADAPEDRVYLLDRPTVARNGPGRRGAVRSRICQHRVKPTQIDILGRGWKSHVDRSEQENDRFHGKAPKFAKEPARKAVLLAGIPAIRGMISQKGPCMNVLVPGGNNSLKYLDKTGLKYLRNRRTRSWGRFAPPRRERAVMSWAGPRLSGSRGFWPSVCSFMGKQIGQTAPDRRFALQSREGAGLLARPKESPDA